MNDEIKEILDDLLFTTTLENVSIKLNKEKLDQLKDYITNLQEQLHQASLDIQELTERDIECPSWCDKLTNLQEEIEHLEKVADERMSTILDIEKYCIDEKEDLISGCEVCEDILKIIEKLKNKKYYIKNTFTKRQIQDYKSRIEKAVEYIEHSKFIKEQVIMKSNYDMQDFQVKELLNILNGRSDE